jgi:ATP-dependent Clp protease ATP-binding subunit ClpC
MIIFPKVKTLLPTAEEALRLGHDFIGTEHLMLGILRDGNGKTIQILNNLSVDLDHLRKKVNSKSATSVETNLEEKTFI